MTTPPFSPILMGGLLLRAIPPELVQPVAERLARRLQDRHPGIFERLAPLGPRSFAIDVTDLPWLFLLSVAEGEGHVEVRAKSDETAADARIHAPLKVLFGLLDGSIDGDAMFFTRDLAYEGDTEAVVALRNALDGADVDFIADIASAFGPLSGAAQAVAEKALAGFSRAEADLAAVGESLIQPVVRRTDAQARRIEELEERCARLEKALRRVKTMPT
ncbi:ubiquinone anaerobic biosynthesis accessory factor UbiT [Oleispirillum naphthae]|uniref:ubiquinone anaerobic biosynthesis accessory factor UbiT n=1 Tax=Oleispirillum naphthae TaxID=2838853 RepID=UPI0030825A77